MNNVLDYIIQRNYFFGIYVSFILPALQLFQQQNPKLHIRYLVDEQLLKLEYGHVHVAIRSGSKPTHPDYVVKAFY